MIDMELPLNLTYPEEHLIIEKLLKSQSIRKILSPELYLSFLNLTDLNRTHIIDWVKRYEGTPRTSSPPVNAHREDQDQCLRWMDLLDFVHGYYIPVITIFGLIGNLLSCVVFLTTSLRLRSSSYYLGALSIADFTFLASLLLVWFNNHLGLLVFNKEGWCQWLVYTSSVSSFLSVWLIVAFTCERFIAIQFPLRRPRVCTVSRAKTVVVILAMTALLAHSYVFFTAGVVQVDGTEVCEMKEEYNETMRVINMIDSVVTLMIPLFLIVIMNTIITRNLIIFGRQFKDQQTQENGESSQAPRILMTEITGRFSSDRSSGSWCNRKVRGETSQGSTKAHRRSSISIDRVSQPSHPTSAPPPRLRHVARSISTTRYQQNITKMMLAISTVSVVLNLPSYIIRIYVFLFFSI